MTNEKPEEGKKTFGKKYVLILLSLIASIALWLFVVDGVDPVLQRTFNDIPVEVLNQEGLEGRDLAIVEDIEEYVNVKVSGKRSSILKLKNEDLVAVVDLSGCTEGDNYVDVDVHMPTSVELESLSKPQILVSLEQIVTEKKEVKVSFAGGTSEQLEAVCVSQELEETEVRGAKSQVAKVDNVEASVDVALLGQEEETITVVLEAVDENGDLLDNLMLSQKEMEVRAAMYKVSAVALTVNTYGTLPEGLELVSVKAPETVRLAMSAEQESSLTGVQAKSLDLSGITETATVELELVLPDKVGLAEGEAVPKAVITVKKTEQ